MHNLLCLFVILTGCSSKWSVEDIDGDGNSLLNGDCWDSLNDPIPPEGALDFGVTAADIYVGAEDLPYDGIDANCDGQNDFDSDGDGFVSLQFEGIPTLGLEGSEAAIGGDCWDVIDEIIIQNGAEDYNVTAFDIHPDAIENFYDGIDQNCDFMDDFDADGDGYVPSSYAGLFTHTLGEEVLPDGDCVDGSDYDSLNPAGLPASDIHPSATEVWYDGTDQDCANDNDCDSDADGASFGPEGSYCAENLPAEEQDCDDSDPEAFPNDTVEVYYNGVDDNCDLSDGDGDADGDDFWAADYLQRVANPGPSVQMPDILEHVDCWDDPDEIPSGFDALNELTQPIAVEVNPSATDASYDGVNQDCGDENQLEFDADNDGFNTAHYLERDGSSGADCIDSVNDPGYFLSSGLDPADIFPNAGDDAYYDGVDQDCNGLGNEYDQDGDGETIDLIDCNGIISSTCDFNSDGVDDFVGGSDCDDNDDEINTNSSEIVSDGIDQNCDNLELCYIDSDGDLFGGTATTVVSDLNCTPNGIVSDVNTDCDDQDEHTNPSAIEICDGKINQCNGSLPSTEVDNDGDGYVACTIDASGWDGASIIGDEDCDDTDNSIYPSAIEICDGQINLCNGSLPSNEIDNDSDGYVACTIDSGGWDGSSILGGDDCDDADATISPISVEICDGLDNNCDLSLPLNEIDNDGDDYVDCSIDSGGWDGVSILGGDDCDDADATVSPSASEICDGQVNLCNGSLPLNETDNDGDGYVACTIDSGGWDGSSILGGDDCDDADATVSPSASEICDGQVNLCNGSLPLNETDDDGDGYVDCTIDIGGWDGSSILGGDDCDDADATVSPVANEICDGQLNLCSGSLSSNEIDDDGDGYVDCTIDSGGWDGSIISGGDDCNDSDGSIFPNANEICDGQDNDCQNGVPSNEVDNDGDGYVECTIDNGGWDGVSITGGEDCDDTTSNFSPGATEGVGDELDQNCDGQEICVFDFDNDGQGDTNTNNTINSLDTDCTDVQESTMVQALDCNDNDNSVFWGASEIPGDGIDQDCDTVDDCYYDADNDGQGGINSVIQTGGDINCSGTNESSNNWDCDETRPTVYFGSLATEVPGDGIDQDCDGLDWCFFDADGDGFGSTSEISSTDLTCTSAGVSVQNNDCNDDPGTGGAIFPNATEIVGDNVDQNCDGLESCYEDVDNDDYGVSSNILVIALTSGDCGQQSGVSSSPGDCDDGDSSRYPYASEIPNDGIDDNCDGLESFGLGYSDCEGELYSNNTGDVYYLYCQHNETWSDARTICESVAYDSLATVSGNQDKEDLKALTDVNSWIGLNDLSQEGNFTWSDGSALIYTYWANGEPDGGTSENCVTVRSGNGRWQDDDCSQTKYFVCSTLF
jgi:hypothetical protein